MSQNLIERAISQLNQLEPSLEAIDRVLNQVPTKRPSRVRPWILSGSVGVATLVLLWPRGEASMAWAQVVEQMKPTRYTLVADFGNESLRYHWEVKEDLAKGFLYRLHSIRKAIQSAPVVLSESIKGPQGHYLRNQDAVEISKDSIGPKNAEVGSGYWDMDWILKTKGAKQSKVERAVASPFGLADVYHVQSQNGQMSFLAYVDAAKTRLLAIDGKGQKGETMRMRFSYPASFSDTEFRFPTTGPKPIDLDALRETLHRRLKVPVARLRVKGVVSDLLGVFQDTRRVLWVVWRGGRPAGDLKEHASLVDAPGLRAFGIAQLVDKPGKNRSAQIGGHALQTTRALSKVDLRIPVFKSGSGPGRFVGYTVVRGIPVERIGWISSVTRFLDPH